jgi:Leucine-rich repeat (LRR) protein
MKRMRKRDKKGHDCSSRGLTVLIVKPTWSTLTRLDCSNNHLTSLPPELGNLTALEWFGCSDNQLISLPPELGNLIVLERFFCSDNKLTTLPPELGNLTALKVFYCFNNQLTSLPPELGNLTALEVFFCNDNRLTTLPPELGNLTALKWINYYNHSIETYWTNIENMQRPMRCDLLRRDYLPFVSLILKAHLTHIFPYQHLSILLSLLESFVQ